MEQFDAFSWLKLLFLGRNWHCWSPNDTHSQDKTGRTAVWRAVCVKIIAFTDVDMDKILSMSTSTRCSPAVPKLLRHPCGYG